MVTTTPPRPIVVGVDGSPSSIDALRKAAELARALDLPIKAVTVWQIPVAYDAMTIAAWSPEDDAKEILAEAIDTAFAHEPPATLSSVTVAGPSARSLIKESEHASMLVVGSRGRGGVAGMLLGSVSTSCAQHAHCPVLIMHDSDRKHTPADETARQEHAASAM